MSKQSFIVLMIGYIFVFLAHLFCRHFPKPPGYVEEARANLKEVFQRQPKWYLKFLYCIGILFHITYVIGFCGLLFFWKIAPWIIVFSLIIDALAYPKMVWNAVNGWEEVAGKLRDIYTGMILALIFFGPARHLFFSS